LATLEKATVQKEKISEKVVAEISSTISRTKKKPFHFSLV
jgi:hypothetical protein